MLLHSRSAARLGCPTPRMAERRIMPLTSHGSRRVLREVAVWRTPPPSGHGRLSSSTSTDSSTSSTDSKTEQSQEYNRLMQQAMGWHHVNPYEYHFDRGLYWHEVGTNLICGSQPRNPDDISRLKDVGVTTIVNLQQDHDMQHWNVNRHDNERRCHDLGINWVHRPARDFDPHSLRKVIPSAVQAVHEGLKNEGRVYVHCTAGLGRAPAVCIAYLHWFTDMQLDEAYQHLTDIRPCGPRRDAIRGATYDLMSGGDFAHFESLPPHAFASMNPDDRNGVQYRCLGGF